MSFILSQNGSNMQEPSKSGLKEQPIVTIDLNESQCAQIWPDENVLGAPAGSKFLCESYRIPQTRVDPQHIAAIFKKYVGYNVILESLGEDTGKFNVLVFTDKGL